MSGDDHGHSSGHGHDSVDVPADIIPIGSWQDYTLLAVCIATLVGFYFWAAGFQAISLLHRGDHGGETHTAPGSAE